MWRNPKENSHQICIKSSRVCKDRLRATEPFPRQAENTLTNWSVSCCQLQGLASADGPMNLARVASDSGPGFWYSNTAVPVRLVLVARLKPLDLAALFQNGKSFRFAKTGYGRLFFGRK